MLHIEDGQLRSLTMENIDTLIQKLNNEKVRRRNEDRVKKINAFQHAWNELKDTGIRISYYEEYDEITLDNWDGFNFD